MKHWCLIGFVLFCLVSESKAQNLVPNPSFEQGVDCVNPYLVNAIPWCTANSNMGTSAYYQSCQTASLFKTPYQYNDPCMKSYQIPHSGVAYIDIGSFVMSSVQESTVPQVKLIDTLKSGKIYCVTYYVSVWNNAKYTIDKLGALLTPTPFPCFVAGGPTVAIAGQYTPQVVSTPSVAIGDTLNWTEVSGSFTAIGNEAYLAIGDFFTHSQHYILNKYPTNCNGLALYYVDEVSVEEVEIAKAKNDTVIYATDSVIIGNNSSEAALFSWQPTTGLSCTNCPNPKASPSVTTTYTVTKTQCKSVTSDVITITVSPTGLTEEEQLAKNLFIYPNPTKDKITIKINSIETEHFNMRLSDVLGKEIMYDKLKTELDIAFLENGIYFLQLYKNDHLLITKKVIKN
jgi:hypothetical protein